MSYSVIYADPPWRYSFSQTKNRSIENHYPTMTLEEICSLPVPSSDDAVLYLWATAPKLIEALQVMKAWGFTYKTHAIWDKQRQGMGYWFRGQHELLLVGTRGKVSPPPSSLRVPSVISEARTRHSAKPDLVRDLITQWFPNSKRLELFARKEAPGWDVWGNEVEPGIQLAA
jgi:N6-adenosine-specific RNA methylase IME4